MKLQGNRAAINIQEKDPPPPPRAPGQGWTVGGTLELFLGTTQRRRVCLVE